jgi:hypothetical protein
LKGFPALLYLLEAQRGGMLERESIAKGVFTHQLTVCLSTEQAGIIHMAGADRVTQHILCVRRKEASTRLDIEMWKDEKFIETKFSSERSELVLDKTLERGSLGKVFRAI